MRGKDSNIISSMADEKIGDNPSAFFGHMISYPLNQFLAGSDMPSNASDISLDDTECRFHIPLLMMV
jgi:hypothetical protein